MSKSVVVTSRKWKEVQVRAFVTSESVGAEVSLDDFLKALAEEIGNPTLIMRKAQMLSRLRIAATSALSEMKEATRYVV